MSCDCKCTVALPHSAMGRSAVCDCGLIYYFLFAAFQYDILVLKSGRLIMAPILIRVVGL